MQRVNRTMTATMALLACAALARADLLNGGFDDGLNGWMHDNTDDVIVVTNPEGNNFARFQEEGIGTRTRLHRILFLPDDPTVLAFRPHPNNPTWRRA